MSTDKRASEVAAFLRDVLEVYERHGIAISHEDGHGGFEIVAADDHHREWLLAATDRRPMAEAARIQRQSAEDHERYEESRDAGHVGFARHYADLRAYTFRKSWRIRFGTSEPEAWA